MKAISLKNLKCKTLNHDYQYFYTFLSIQDYSIIHAEILKCKHCKKNKIVKKPL